MSKYVLLIAATVTVIAGCRSGREQFQAKMDSWIGATEDQLVSNWGPPTSTYPLSDGGKVLTYSNRGPSTYVVNYNMVRQNYRTCDALFTTDSTSHIVSHRWQGNGCR